MKKPEHPFFSNMIDEILLMFIALVFVFGFIIGLMIFSIWM